MTLDEAWRSRYAAGEISPADLAFAIRHHMNVVKDTSTVLTVVKNNGDDRRDVSDVPMQIAGAGWE